MKRAANSFDIAVAAELADEAASGFEATDNTFDDSFRFLHPMQRGIGKYCIEDTTKAQPLSVHGYHIDTAPAGCLELRRARIDADNPRAKGGDFFGQRAVAASEIQNTLARTRIEEIQQRLAQV